MTTQQHDLDGLKALVTGATSGLGRAIAFQLARDGADVTVHGRDVGRGVQTVEEIQLQGGRAHFVAADLADAASIARFAKAFRRMDGAPILSIEIAQNKAYTALFGVPTQDFFDFIQRDPSLLAGIPTLARVAAYGGGLPIKVNGELVGAIGVSGAPTVQNDIDCARAALALVSDAVPTD